MNRRHGHFRLWLAVSAIWALFIVLVFMAPRFSETPAMGWGTYILSMLVGAVAPPLVVFIIGLLLIWASKGFQRGNG